MSDDYVVEAAEEPAASSGYRSYEVYQRERVGETTNLVSPRDLISDEYLTNPFTVPGVLRENYPCFRDWVGNRFWVTRYDDVTSVFVDDANFETRLRSRTYGDQLTGRDLGGDAALTQAWVELCDAATDLVIGKAVDELEPSCDLASDFADSIAHNLVGAALDRTGQAAALLPLIETIKVGCGWNERDRHSGLAALEELRPMLETRLRARKRVPSGDLLTVFADLDVSIDDVIVTLVEMDLATLPASLATLWGLLLAHEDQFQHVKAEPRLMKFAYLEALRHSPPTPTADRYTKQEVERFGRLLPEGALVHLSAAAANRDPRQFGAPDAFDLQRKDLCQREPRGHYRADGLPAGIVFGHGKPSPHPAEPKQGVRSRYALTRDVAVAASLRILERFPDITMASGVKPRMDLDRLGGTYRCRKLPVQLN